MIANHVFVRRAGYLLLLFCLIFSFGMAYAGETKTVTDMRGKDITIPQDPERVVILDRGLIAQTMRALGVEDKIVGSGGLNMPTVVNPTDHDTQYLVPALLNYGDLGYPRRDVGVNAEGVAFANPDLVIFLQSEYTNTSARGLKDEAVKRIEDMGIPLVMINGPGLYDKPDVKYTHQAVEILGFIFNKEDRAKEIVSYLQEQEKMISDRTRDIPDKDKPKTMIMGVGNESSGIVFGEEMGDAKFSTQIAHIKNVYKSKDVYNSMSAEQINALNPDVIIMGMFYVIPDVDLFSKPEYKQFREINAVKNNRIGSIGQLNFYGDLRLDYPTMLLIEAKTAYPEQFKDINGYTWLMNHYKTLYGLTGSEADELAKIQYLDWMKEKNF